MNLLLSTNTVKEYERTNYWRDLVCDVFVQLDVKPILEESSFFGAIETSHLRKFQFSNVISHGQKVIRSKHQIAKSVDDYFLISFQLNGHGKVSQDGRIAHLNPGDWALYDSTRPYELFFTNKFSQLVLQLPRSELDERLTLPEEATSRTISGKKGLGKLSRELVISTWQEIEHIHPSSIDRLLYTIADLLSSAVNESYIVEPQTSRSNLIKTIEIKNFIREQIRNPQLSTEMIADTFNVSSRSLYYLFQKTDTSLSQFIRELRLKKCKEDLADPQQRNHTITDILFSWGFNSSAHFSYLFKKCYGMSPKSYRDQIVENLKVNK